MTNTVATSGATASRAVRASSRLALLAAPARHTWHSAFRTSFLFDSLEAARNSFGSEVSELGGLAPCLLEDPMAAVSAPILRSLASAAAAADRFFTSDVPTLGAIFFICSEPTPQAPEGIPTLDASSHAPRSTHIASPFFFGDLFLVCGAFAFFFGGALGDASWAASTWSGMWTPAAPVARPGTPHSFSTTGSSALSTGSTFSIPSPVSLATTPNHVGNASGGASSASTSPSALAPSNTIESSLGSPGPHPPSALPVPSPSSTFACRVCPGAKPATLGKGAGLLRGGIPAIDSSMELTSSRERC
mmetsp:Transcript_6587/g.29765  ORF Transcript_6587/g.29765 Transcript_6587/m.29765 type:complete len:304 (+) Transcript_6587:340-1251(+)